MPNLPKGDILTEADIAELIDKFYARVRRDGLLAPVFNEAIKDKWDEHLQTMRDFWSTLLLFTRKYSGDTMAKHLVLDIGKEHFRRWLQLFTLTVDELFEGENASEAKKRAGHIARLIQVRKNPSDPNPEF